MKISFDGLRRNIVRDFNSLVSTIKSAPSADLCDDVNNLRASIGCLLSCYDKDQQPDDFNDLSNVELEEL